MPRRLLVVVLAVAACASGTALAQSGVAQSSVAQSSVKNWGKAVVQYTSADVTGVVSYEYAQRNHDTPWLITQMAFQPTRRVELKRDQFALITPDGRRLPLASRKEMGAERAVVAHLSQQAAVATSDLMPYFSAPLVNRIPFSHTKSAFISDVGAYASPDEPAVGVLMFRSPEGRWAPGTYRLVFTHEKAKAEFPLELK